MSYVNHCRRPNANWSYRLNVDAWIVNATHLIPKDTEITVSYVHFLRCFPRSQRDELTKAVWGFSFACELCSLPPDSTEPLASDMRRVLLLGLLMLLEGTNGKIAPDVMRTALRGSNGMMLCGVKPSLASTYTDAHHTFACFLIAKLHEAEGWFSEAMGDAYMSAASLLQTSMTNFAQLGKGVKNVDSWCKNIKHWHKIAGDKVKVCLKHEGTAVYVGEEGQYPWEADEARHKHFQLKQYDANGGVKIKRCNKTDLVKYFRLELRGELFCKEYINEYAHLCK